MSGYRTRSEATSHEALRWLIRHEADWRCPWSIVVKAERLPLDAMIWHAEQAEALGPIIDPTLHRAKGPKMAQDLAMLRALRDMVTAAQRAAGRRADS